MPYTPNKVEKVKKLIKDWERLKDLSLEEIGSELGVSGRTVYAWRKELERRGKVLEMGTRQLGDKNIFDSLVK